MAKITKIGQKGLDLIKSFEGLYLKPYLCPANVPTIGYGNTFYENGNKVTLKDPIITEARAIELLMSELGMYEQKVDSYCIDTINQNQFDALVDFAYNCGNGNLKSSTLLKKVNANPNLIHYLTHLLSHNADLGKEHKNVFDYPIFATLLLRLLFYIFINNSKSLL